MGGLSGIRDFSGNRLRDSSPENPMTPEEVVALEERLEANPKSRSFLQLAEAYLEHGETGKALPLLVQGVEYYPYYLAARITLGQVQKKQGLLDDAIKNFEFVTRTIPDNLIAQKSLALLFFQQGETEKAKEALSLALGLSPNDAELLALQEKIDHPTDNLPDEQGPVSDQIVASIPEATLLDSSSIEQPEPAEEEAPSPQTKPYEVPAQEAPVDLSELSGEPIIEPEKDEDENENELLHLIPQTETMGDLFMSQKRYPQAEKIYEAILNQSPENTRISEKLERAKTHTPLDDETAVQPDKEIEPIQKTPETEETFSVPPAFTAPEQPAPATAEMVEDPVPEAPPPSSPIKDLAEEQDEQEPARDRAPSDELLERLKDRLYRDLIGVIFASENGLLLSEHSRDENSEILAAEGIELLRQLDELALSLGQGAPLDGFIWLERSILYFVNRTPEGGLFLWLRSNANIGRCRLIIQQELGITHQRGTLR